MKLFNKFKKIIKPEVAKFQKVIPVFITTDKKEHIGYSYRWIKSSGLLCSVPKYLMIDINSNGYIEDEDYAMYPLSNVVSIEWVATDEKTTLEPLYSNHYKIFFDDEEVEELEIKYKKYMCL